MKVIINSEVGGIHFRPETIVKGIEQNLSFIKRYTKEEVKYLNLSSQLSDYTIGTKFLYIPSICIYRIPLVCSLENNLFYSIDTYSTNSDGIKCFRLNSGLIKLIEISNKDKIGYGLKVIEIPDDVKFYIHEATDGKECIHEIHRSWS